MTDRELDELLKQARVPDRKPEYWMDFPGIVRLRLRPGSTESVARHPRATHRLAGWAVGLAAACVLLAFIFGFRADKGREGDESMAAMQKYFREMQGLFPNQVRAIIFDGAGPRLILSEKADVPSSSPLLVKFCSGKQCRSFVTFSGQQLEINGQKFEVLAGGGDEVILVGHNSAWSSADPAQKEMHMEAKCLDL